MVGYAGSASRTEEKTASRGRLAEYHFDFPKYALHPFMILIAKFISVFQETVNRISRFDRLLISYVLGGNNEEFV